MKKHHLRDLIEAVTLDERAPVTLPPPKVDVWIGADVVFLWPRCTSCRKRPVIGKARDIVHGDFAYLTCGDVECMRASQVRRSVEHPGRRSRIDDSDMKVLRTKYARRAT